MERQEQGKVEFRERVAKREYMAPELVAYGDLSRQTLGIPSGHYYDHPYKVIYYPLFGT